MTLPFLTGRSRYLLVLLPYLGLLATWDLASNLPVALICFAAALAALFWARRVRPVASLHVVVLVAAGVRLLVLPLPPTLSDDVFRYIWDGKVAGAGFDPYVLAPDAPELADLRDDLWQALPHRDVATVYPPLALTLFSIAARFPHPVFFWKLLLITVELATVIVLFRLAARGGGDGSRAIWYAWNPLAVLEFAGMGHVDALGVCAVVVAVWALATGGKTAVAGLAAAAGVLAKLVPLLAFPIWWRHSRRRRHFAAVAGLLLATALAPVAASSRGVPSGYLRFGRSWEFNGPLYEPLWRSFEWIDSRRGVEGVLDGLKALSGRHDVWNRLYAFNYPRMHARLVLAALLGLLLLRAWRRPDLIRSTGSVFEITILCSATVYPWYLVWLLPFAALEEDRAWLALCFAAPASYVAQFTSATLMPWVFLACWGPYAVIRGPGRRWFTA